MPTCQKCQSKWSWLDSILKLLSFRKTMKCKNCGEKYYQSTSSRKITSMIVLFPLLTIPITVLFNLTLPTILVIELFLVLVALSLMPLFLKLSDTEEPLW